MTANQNHKRISKNLKISAVLNTTFTIFEFLVGLSIGSLALIADAGHNLTDSISLIISLIVNKVSGHKADNDHTYGHGRAGILASFINAAILVVLSVVIFYEAYQHILNARTVSGHIIRFPPFFGQQIANF